MLELMFMHTAKYIDPEIEGIFCAALLYHMSQHEPAAWQNTYVDLGDPHNKAGNTSLV